METKKKNSVLETSVKEASIKKKKISKVVKTTEEIMLKKKKNSVLETLVEEASIKKKKTNKVVKTLDETTLKFVTEIITDAELTPSTIEDVIKQPRFYDTIKAVEKEKGKSFYKVDVKVQDALVLRRLQQMTNNLFLNPFWKERLHGAGINEAPIDFEAWQNIPLTDKETMITAFSGKREGMVIPFSSGGFEIVASGGTSSGIPLETVYELEELQETYKIAGEFIGEFMMDKYLKNKDPKWVATTLADYQMWSSGTMVGGVLQKIPKINYLGAGPLSSEVYGHMMSYKGDKAIMSISSGIDSFTDFGKRLDEAQRNSLKVVMYGSGLLSQKQKDALKEVYPQVKILSYFAATQAETIGLQLNHESNTLSAVPGLHFIEIVDENGKWVKEGEEGELVITRLHSNKVPNIRYKLGDKMVRLKRENTADLKTHQFEFKGRSGDIIHLGDSQYAALKVKDFLFSELDKAGVGISNNALEIQFLNNRKERKLTLLISDSELNKISLQEEEVHKIFIRSLMKSLPLFNGLEANSDYVEKSKYQFEIKVVGKGAKDIFRTPLGKTPLIKDKF